MSELKDVFNKRFRVIFFVVVAFVAVVFLIAQNINTFGNILLTMLGFGSVVLVHEFGHFVVAKLSDIKVEAFSIFMPPTLFGVQRTENGFKFRILPKIFAKEGDESGEGALSFTVGGKGKGKASETEYRLGLIPFGGFVKMLGQEDTGSVKTSDDPRSFANKSAGTRAAVLAAGVVFNVISAVIIFMIVFLIGINLTPAVVGGVVPDSPAARAGLKAGDEVIEVAGKKDDLDFSNIGIAAALSGRDEKIPLRVRHADGSEEDLTLMAEQLPGEPMRLFGVVIPTSLTIGRLSEDDANDLYSKTGLLVGDKIKSANGKDVYGSWELDEVIRNALTPVVALEVERIGDRGEVELVRTQIRLNWRMTNKENIESESELSHIYSMVPRMCIISVSEEYAPKAEDEVSLQPDDVILAIGDVENPTYSEMREVVEKHEDKELPVRILRANSDGTEEALTVTVKPKRQADKDRVAIGVFLTLDEKHPVVAKTIDAEGGPSRLAIPSGAAITLVDGTPVSSFYDVIREIRKYSGQRISIEYRLNEEIAGNVVLNVETNEESVTVKSAFSEIDFIPFAKLERLYKASGPIDAVVMGYRRTVMFVAQTYVTLKRLIGGLVSPKNLMGPVGIITFSYRIVSEQPLVYYVYFLGLISAVIAVFNFLPLPPLDGGLVVILFVEKIKGSALSERVQGVIAYAGWALIGTLVLYVTFNDIVRSFFS
ncbi:MAG TPA: site-2 protease family protein [Sedimentisphaerales bacterium]|nr:site-2 protease family protein [Sedimentisphaerales bacterium]